jgi:hypothetical protein
MGKRVLDAVLVAALFAAPLAALSLPHEEIMLSERRRVAAFPAVPHWSRQRDVKRFFRGVDAFFADRFPLRACLLALPATLYGSMGASPDTYLYFRGKDDWLFLGNSYGGFLDRLQGVVTLRGAEIKRQAARYGRLRDAASGRGARFFVIVSPEKASVYGEFLPLYVIPAPRRYIAPLLEALAASGVAVVEPTERMKAAKRPSAALYYRMDTHWNHLGAYVAFEGFRELAGLPPLPPFSFESLPPVRGDLMDIAGYTGFPVRGGDNFVPRWDPPLPVVGGEESSANPASPSGLSAWVFGDSSAESIRPYFEAMFREARFFTPDEFDREMASPPPGPDVVVWVTVERALV